MNSQEFAEGRYINPEIVMGSQTKIGVIITDCTVEQSQYGPQLICTVEIDKKQKLWQMNRDSVKNMQQIGIDTSSWVGKKVKFQVVSVNGKQRVIGMPMMDLNHQ